eukprot:CCRYP_007869-RC/>CCRYP_007869-RC protein AED:0.02 eAED:0.02 QI:2232/1/1/1/0.66/0.25/4/1921/317
MTRPRLHRVGTALFWVAFAVSFHAPYPVASFSPSRKQIHAPSHSLAAYIYHDGDGSYAGGRESLRNSTLNGGPSITAATDAGRKEEDVDIVGPGTLGDIMAGSAPGSAGCHRDGHGNLSQPAVIDGLVTKEGGELNSKFGCTFSPMERIALTANGNLQRIFSSYYDAPVHVHVDSCIRRNNRTPSLSSNKSLERFSFRIQTDGAVWDRVVHLRVHDKTICIATSVIHVRSPKCVKLIEDGTVGLGQLFRYLNKLPHFSLLDAGRNGDSMQCELKGGMWRTYELQCEEVTCLIHEEFHHNAWNVSPKVPNDGPFKPML